MQHRYSQLRTSNTLLPLTIALALPLLLHAQGAQGGRGGRGGADTPQSPKAASPIVLTGYWVSIVDEDWRFRMVVPPPRDYEGVPMTPAAVKFADLWDPAKDEASGDLCKAFGAPAILRQPEHLHITWPDDHTLRMDADTGTQTRLFHFGDWKAPAGPPTLQGDSIALWEMARTARGSVPHGSLKVTTSHLKAGYLRKNGVPYSENADLTEYYDVLKEHNGDTMLVVTIVVTDPQYLHEPFIITSHFKKQDSDAGWKPTPCTVRW
jgi:hypothetical protein